MIEAINIGSRHVGAGHPPFIVAELSGNHNGSLDRALEIVDAAANVGAHAIKLQTYTAETMTLNVQRPEFYIRDKESLWHGHSLFDLYQKAHTPWEWHREIYRRAADRGLVCFSSPFDYSAVDFLEELESPAYKIASFEIVHIPLIRRVAATGKPVIISTGMSTLDEIDEAVAAARGAGCEQLVLLKCTSTYPASPENSNVVTIPDLRARFDCHVGLSDHTLGIGCALASVALGATVVEKHFTLDRADGGVDSQFSLEPDELRLLVEESERAWQATGKVSYGPLAQEQGSLVFRRSIYVAEDLKAGDVLSEKNLKIIRPSNGLAPKHFEELLGRTLGQDVEQGTPMSWDLLADQG